TAFLDLLERAYYRVFAMSAPPSLPNSVHEKPVVTKSVSENSGHERQPRSPALMRYFEALNAAFGPQHWWPGRSRFEIIIGAILTQNTSWKNVEAAIRNLHTKHLLTAEAIERVSVPKLARLIRASGYFRQKAKKLKAFTSF